MGAHYDVGVDLGEIRDRSFQWTYLSSPHNAGSERWRRLTWIARTPGQTSVRFQIRSASDSGLLDGSPWLGPEGPGSFFTSSGADRSQMPMRSWIQYRVVLDTVNGAASPVVEAVQVDFE